MESSYMKTMPNQGDCDERVQFFGDPQRHPQHDDTVRMDPTKDIQGSGILRKLVIQGQGPVSFQERKNGDFVEKATPYVTTLL